MIRAHAVSDDEDRLEVWFDAEPWFNRSTSEQRRQLKDEEYCMCYLADDICRWTASNTPHSIEKRELRRFYNHIQRNDYGYEVYIDENDVEAWRHRREVQPALDAVDFLLSRR